MITTRRLSDTGDGRILEGVHQLLHLMILEGREGTHGQLGSSHFDEPVQLPMTWPMTPPVASSK